MSSIAKYLISKNFKVGGYDLTKTSITKNLEKSGAQINYNDELKNIPILFKKEKCNHNFYSSNFKKINN